MRSYDNRFIILKTALPDEVGYELLNTCSMGDKGGQGVAKICIEMGSQCLVGNAAVDLPTVYNSHKPYNPSGFIIRFTRKKFYRHRHIDIFPSCSLRARSRAQLVRHSAARDALDADFLLLHLGEVVGHLQP